LLYDSDLLDSSVNILLTGLNRLSLQARPRRGLTPSQALKHRHLTERSKIVFIIHSVCVLGRPEIVET
jgi:hypothetical protein